MSAARAFVVHGKVQGVWFRAFTQRAARELGLGGWVRNRRGGPLDGAVDGEAWGDPEALERLRRKLEEGPPASRVERVDWNPLEERGEAPAEFEIRPTA